MPKKHLKYICFLFLLFVLSCSQSNVEEKTGYPITPVPFTKIKLNDNFWSSRIAVNREVTIPFAFEKCEEEGRMRNFERAGGLLDGEFEGEMPFEDSDVYKIIEGASYSLQTNPDEELDNYIDSVIAKIAAAQEDDGYLNTWKTINPDTTPAWWVKPGPRWHNLGASHELYNVGHLYEAAYAHYRATGKTNLLNIALKNADLIANTFGPQKLETPPGHQIIETGLIKLYRATGKEKYLKLAKYFLDLRGDSLTHKLYGDYSQDHIPVTEQDEAAGHAVRAVYMYAGMTDIAALQKDKDYLDAVDKIWENVVHKKYYITGGIGARREGEAFGDNYELPNLTSYNETCAAIANVYWNHRMFLLHGNAKYIDVLERTLYNGLISGVSLEGDSFFYPNCLASDGRHPFNQGALTRKPWFNCSCCPTNIIRFMPSVPDYIYAQRNDTLYANLFIASDAAFNIENTEVGLNQVTEYPWDGKVKFTLSTEDDVSFTFNIRIPGWAQNNPAPGDLYTYLEENPGEYTIKVNGKTFKGDLNKGYTGITREWSDGDVVELELPMQVHRVLADEKVKDDSGRVALERGPIVYCAEWVDNNGKVDDLVVPDDAQFTTEYQKDLLNGITVLRSAALKENGEEDSLTVIPYYAWSHRGIGEMAVWLKRK